MKKSIKYAGIAAATLLAVAPVAAPVLSSTTVKAETRDSATNDFISDDKALSAADAQFNSKFSGTTEANEVGTKFGIIPSQDGTVTSAQATAAKNTLAGELQLNHTFANFTDFVGSETAQLVANTNGEITFDPVYNQNNQQVNVATLFTKTDDKTATTAAGANMQNISVTAKATNEGGTTSDVSDGAGLLAAITDPSYKSVELTTTYTYVNPDGSKTTKTAVKTFSNTNMALTEVHVTYQTPYNVAKDQTVTDSQIINASDFKMVDQNGKTVLSSYAKPVASYYTSARAAANNTGLHLAAATDVEQAATSTNTNAIVAPKFKTAGSYYQPIVVTLPANGSVKNFLDAALDNSSKNTFTVNGVTYGDINTDNFNYSAANHTITFVRKINVSDSTSQWTYTKQSGVVTTKDASNYYTLVDNNNDSVGNRALGKNSAWLTDQYRTNQSGVKQYRVATGEWIDANNVTFSDKATTPSDNSALTDIQNQNGTVTLDAPASFNYLLYTKSGELGNRALSGDSAWKVIQTAKDSKGRTYYRVSTTEWVMEGNGVHFTAE